MSTQVTLKAGLRDGKGKGGARKLRTAGGLPAVVYGGEAGPVSLELNAHDTELLFRSISVENTIVQLQIEGTHAPVQTLVREIQTHPYRPTILHVDFLRIQSGVEVELEIPLHFAGMPKGVRDSGGVLDQTLHTLPVRCIPSEIPDDIQVDVSELDVGDMLHVSDLPLPQGVEALIEGDRVVCSIQAPTVLASEDEEEDEEEGEPEVIGRDESEEDEDED